MIGLFVLKLVNFNYVHFRTLQNINLAVLASKMAIHLLAKVAFRFPMQSSLYSNFSSLTAQLSLKFTGYLHTRNIKKFLLMLPITPKFLQISVMGYCVGRKF